MLTIATNKQCSLFFSIKSFPLVFRAIWMAIANLTPLSYNPFCMRNEYCAHGATSLLMYHPISVDCGRDTYTVLGRYLYVNNGGAYLTTAMFFRDIV